MDEQNGVNRGVKISPFLHRLWSIVNDPNTNDTISWTSLGTHIIIRDHIKFTTDLLPIYFKHRNFASFVYQLNNYGFKKTEYGNGWEYQILNFQAGKEYLLRNITRRDIKPRSVTTPQDYRRSTLCSSNIKVEALRSGIKELEVEIEELKGQQEEIELQIAELQNVQAKYDSITDFLTSAAGDELVVAEPNNKKRKLSSTESSVENGNLNGAGVGFEILEANGDQENVETMLVSGNQSATVSSDEAANHVDQGQGHDNPEHTVKRDSSIDCLYWQQILLDDSSCHVCDNDEQIGEMRKERAEIAAELEGIIANLPN